MNTDQIERWDIFEIALDGPDEGNPFVDVQLSACFRHKNRVVPVDGFYDGEGVFRVRFMPDTPGVWTYETRCNEAALNGQGGEFTCVAAAEGNHGPVRVRNTYHLAYEDGTSHVSVGTTCYAWAHQGDELEEQTLETLRSAPFNKMRMCIFPKRYTFSENEPVYYPYRRTECGDWDLTRFDPSFWRHFEARVGQLRDLGIEADIILFHPYDCWGFATMDAASDDHYLRYAVARLAAYRNVWWSMANEFDLMEAKTELDWDRFFHIVQESDPYQRLRSIHNCHVFYDHNKPWVTHQSIQRHDLTQVSLWRAQCKKPVVVDECCYEGNVHQGWGAITAEELVHRFWEGASRGGYVGHGETYMHPEDILWWSKGGVLHGQSPERIAFLRHILEEGPAEGLDTIEMSYDLGCAGRAGEYYLVYTGRYQMSYVNLSLPEGVEFAIEVIDTWEMTIAPLTGTFSGGCRVDLLAKPHIALRVRRV
ncbi:MAG: DUF5060 domain-containing protein [Anaerolineae bacterium]|nr:DUF5060 domain-containing protein [Anaerolineae bacterium]